MLKTTLGLLNVKLAHHNTLTWIIPSYPLGDYQRGESQLITQLPFFYSLFSCSYPFSMFIVDNYLIYFSNHSLFYPFPLFVVDNYPHSSSNHFLFYPFPLFAMDNYLLSSSNPSFFYYFPLFVVDNNPTFLNHYFPSLSFSLISYGKLSYLFL